MSDKANKIKLEDNESDLDVGKSNQYSSLQNSNSYTNSYKNNSNYNYNTTISNNKDQSLNSFNSGIYNNPGNNAYNQNSVNFNESSNQVPLEASYKNFQVIKNTKSEELEDTREYYIDCAKTTSALIPKSLRKSVGFFNSMFVLGGFSLISFNLYGFIKYYPETFSQSHKVFVMKNSLILGSITLGSYFMLKKLYNDSYDSFKGNKSDNEVRMLIEQFYDVNKNNLNKTLEKVQDNQQIISNNSRN